MLSRTYTEWRDCMKAPRRRLRYTPKTMAAEILRRAPVHTEIDPVRHMGQGPAKLPLQDSDAVKSAPTGTLPRPARLAGVSACASPRSCRDGSKEL